MAVVAEREADLIAFGEHRLCWLIIPIKQRVNSFFLFPPARFSAILFA
jgi:hypothetical protein